MHILLLGADGGIHTDCIRPVDCKLLEFHRIWLDKKPPPISDIFKELHITESDAIQGSHFKEDTIVHMMEILQLSTLVLGILAVVLFLSHPCAPEGGRRILMHQSLMS